jgi:hypothetical protein
MNSKGSILGIGDQCFCDPVATILLRITVAPLTIHCVRLKENTLLQRSRVPRRTEGGVCDTAHKNCHSSFMPGNDVNWIQIKTCLRTFTVHK